MGTFNTRSDGTIDVLLDSNDLGSENDVMTRVGSGAEFKPPSGGGASILHQATVELTDAQIKALPTTSVQIVAAPGANKLLLFERAVLQSNLVSPYTNLSAYSGGDGTINITTPEGDNLIVSDYMESATSIMADSRIFIMGRNVKTNADGLSFGGLDPEVNGGFFIQAYNTGDFTGGDAANTLRVSVTYYILDVTTGVFE